MLVSLLVFVLWNLNNKWQLFFYLKVADWLATYVIVLFFWVSLIANYSQLLICHLVGSVCSFNHYQTKVTLIMVTELCCPRRSKNQTPRLEITKNYPQHCSDSLEMPSSLFSSWADRCSASHEYDALFHKASELLLVTVTSGHICNWA